MGKRIHLTPKQHEEILERDAYVCAYCNGPATEIDHITPWIVSQDNSPVNLVACCHDCNAIAHDKAFASIGEKRAYIMQRKHNKRWRQKNERALCTDCGAFYRPRVKEATVFLFPSCATACKQLGPKSYAEYLNQRREEIANEMGSTSSVIEAAKRDLGISEDTAHDVFTVASNPLS